MGSPERGSGAPGQDRPSSPAGAQAPDKKKDRDHELRNADYIDEIMVGDDPALHTELKEFLLKNGMKEKDIELSFESRRLRHRVHEEMDREKERRLAENPAPTDDELSLGVYLEDIEPHVRDAVSALRKKGYSTHGSGFQDFNWQSIYLDKDRSDFNLVPEDVREKLAAMGVTFDRDGGQLSFACDEIDLEKMKTKWDEIVAMLPDLGIKPIDHEPAYLAFAQNARKHRGRSYPRYEKYYDRK